MAAVAYIVELVAAVASALVVGAVVALTALLLWAGPAGAAVLDAGLNCPPCVHRGQMLLTLVLAVAAGGLKSFSCDRRCSLPRKSPSDLSSGAPDLPSSRLRRWNGSRQNAIAISSLIEGG
jgi:hypothetical protein